MAEKRGRKRRYVGEPQGSQIARWLNKSRLDVSLVSPRRLRQATVAEIVQEIIAALRLDDGSASAVALNRIYHRYHFEPLAFWDSRAKRVRSFFTFPPGESYSAMPAHLEGSFILVALWELTTQGREAIHRLRTCDHCGKWLFAWRRDQHFCAGGACREAAHAHDEARAKKRRQQAKERYDNIKAGKCKPRSRKHKSQRKRKDRT